MANIDVNCEVCRKGYGHCSRHNRKHTAAVLKAVRVEEANKRAEEAKARIIEAASAQGEQLELVIVRPPKHPERVHVRHAKPSPEGGT